MQFLTYLSDNLEHFLGPAPYGASWSQYILALSVLLICFVIRALTRPVLSTLIEYLSPKADVDIRERIANALIPPLRTLPLLIGFYAAIYIMNFSDKLASTADRVLSSGIVAAFFWGVSRLVANSDVIWSKLHTILDSSSRRWLRYTAQILVLAMGAAIILEIWNIPVAPIIGSMGVFGIAIGLAAKDLLSNLISGLLIMTEKRFVPGDWVEVEGVVNGTVEQIDFRSTRIRKFDLSPVYVPNSALADNAMTNFSRMTYRRINWTIGLEYATLPKDLSNIRDQVEAWLQNDERISQPPNASLFVRIDSFGENSINLMIYCFTKTIVWSEWLKIKEEFALALIPIVKNSNSGFAFPSRSIFLQHIDPPEIFNPEAEIKK